MQACWYMLIRKPRVDASRVRVPGEANDWLPDGWATQADTHAFTPLPMAAGGVVNIRAQGQLLDAERKKTEGRRDGGGSGVPSRATFFLKQSLFGSAQCIHLYS